MTDSITQRLADMLGIDRGMNATRAVLVLDAKQPPELTITKLVGEDFELTETRVYDLVEREPESELAPEVGGAESSEPEPRTPSPQISVRDRETQRGGIQ